VPAALDRNVVRPKHIARNLAAVVLGFVVYAAGASAPAGSAARTAVAHKTSKASPAAQPAETGAIVPYGGICDTSDVLTLVGDLTDDDNKRDNLAILQGRIIDCSRRIAAALAQLPSPSPTPYWVGPGTAPVPAVTPHTVCVSPPPAATPATSPFALYETLTQCFGYLTYLHALPTPAPADSPLSSIASQPTFYVFATGAVDPTTAAVMIRSVVGKLTLARAKSTDAAPLAIAGRAGWTDRVSFADQCKYDPNTRGALVIETSIPETSRRNYLLLIANITNVSAAVEMLGCGEDDHTSAGLPLSLWSANDLTGKAHETALTTGILSQIATLFLTDRSSTTVSISNKTVNVASSQQSAPVLSGNVAGYLQDQNLNLPAQNASTELSVAGDRFARSTLERLQVFCEAPEVRRIAALARPPDAPAPPAHRTLPYKAAALYVEDCARFADFKIHP